LRRRRERNKSLKMFSHALSQGDFMCRQKNEQERKREREGAQEGGGEGGQRSDEVIQ
jgi:hypothetical protein